jgi:hypothetical protein
MSMECSWSACCIPSSLYSCAHPNAFVSLSSTWGIETIVSEPLGGPCSRPGLACLGGPLVSANLDSFAAHGIFWGRSWWPGKFLILKEKNILKALDKPS